MRTPLLIALCLVITTTEAQEPSIRVDVFTDSRHPVSVDSTSSSLQVNYYDLDAAPRFEETLSAGLPADPLAAERLARQRLQTLDLSHYASQLRAAFRGALLAHSYALVKYPALVFDGEAVVYGVRSLDDALQRYRRWRSGQVPP